MARYIPVTCVAVAANLTVAVALATAETTITPVFTAAIQGMPNTEAKIPPFDVDPGWTTDHHIHPGQLFVYVLEGSLHLEVDGENSVDYSAGEAFCQIPNLGMIGANLSAPERARFVVFQFGEAGHPLMIAN